MHALITHNRFTLANRNASDMLDLAAARGIAVFNAAPYAGGVFAKGTGSYRRDVYQEASEAMLDPIRRIEEVCAHHSVPPGAAALQFSMRDPRIASTICGVSKPERVAETVPYLLTDAEQDLYEQVTSYVTEGMNRADKLDGKRRNTVGFALTVLQRRLASSPEAIYQSLRRRAARLERRRNDILAGRVRGGAGRYAARPAVVALVVRLARWIPAFARMTSVGGNGRCGRSMPLFQ